MTKREIMTCRDKAKELGVLKWETHGIEPRRCYYHVDLGRILALLQQDQHSGRERSSVSDEKALTKVTKQHDTLIVSGPKSSFKDILSGKPDVARSLSSSTDSSDEVDDLDACVIEEESGIDLDHIERALEKNAKS